MEGFPSGSDSKTSACNAGDLDSIPGSGRSPGEGNGYPLDYSCLENPMDRRAWCSPWGHKESDMTEQLTFSLHKIICRSYDKHSHSFLGRYNSAYPILKVQGRLFGGGNTLMSPKPSGSKFSHFSGI